MTSRIAALKKSKNSDDFTIFGTTGPVPHHATDRRLFLLLEYLDQTIQDPDVGHGSQPYCVFAPLHALTRVWITDQQ